MPEKFVACGLGNECVFGVFGARGSSLENRRDKSACKKFSRPQSKSDNMLRQAPKLSNNIAALVCSM